MRQCYTKEGKAETPLTHPLYRNTKPARLASRAPGMTDANPYSAVSQYACAIAPCAAHPGSAFSSARVHFPNIKQLSFPQIIAAKNRHNPFTKSFRFEKGEPPMRIKHAIFVGSMAALASHTAPALAKHSDAQTTSEQSTSSPCSARQPMPDGTWAQLPCQELGSPKQPARKSATRSSDEQRQ
jgi:hypothetical protein